MYLVKLFTFVLVQESPLLSSLVAQLYTCFASTFHLVAGLYTCFPKIFRLVARLWCLVKLLVVLCGGISRFGKFIGSPFKYNVIETLRRLHLSKSDGTVYDSAVRRVVSVALDEKHSHKNNVVCNLKGTVPQLSLSLNF